MVHSAGSMAAVAARERAGVADAWGIRYVVGVFVLLRVALSALAAWLLTLHPLHDTLLIRAQYLGQTPLHDLVLAPWQRFDAFWYLRLATQGYGAHDGSTVYFPLYPLLIKIVAFPLLGNTMLAALLIPNACCVGLLILLHRFVADRHGIAAARRTVLLLCVFPTAVFLVGAYTESLFLLLVVGCFVAADRQRPYLAGSLGLLAALTRVQGGVLVLPLLWIAVQRWRAGNREMGLWIGALLPALGITSFLLYVHSVVRAGFITSTYHDSWSMAINPPWATLGAFWSGLMAHHWRIFAYPTGNWVDLLNIVLALGAVALVIPARRLLGTPLWLYALVTWCVTLSLHQSTARYMLTVFPALIALAVWAPGRWTVRFALLVGAPLMLFVAGEFVLWSFVG